MTKIVVVAYDAGASEILCAYIKENFKKADWTLIASTNSPFKRIAYRNGLKTSTELDTDYYDALFLGTSWQESAGKEFLKMAKANNTPTFSFFDHWSAYRERFGYPSKGWKENLTDFNVLSDKNAYSIAKSLEFPNLIQVNNYYLQKQIETVRFQPTQSSCLLFLGEPTSEVAFKTYGDENYWGFTQNSALEDILNMFARFNCSSLKIRLHPSEKNNTYREVLNKFPHIPAKIYKASKVSIEEDVMDSKVTIGFDTMALYTAALLGQTVLSYVPSQNRICYLPFPSTHKLKSLRDLTMKNLLPLNLKLHNNGASFEYILKAIMEFKPC